MNWTETDKLDSFKRREFAVSFESSDEYDEFYADCKAVGIDYHPLGYFMKPPRDELTKTYPNVLVYFFFENNIIRWVGREILKGSPAANADIVPYSDLVAYGNLVSDVVPIPEDTLKKLCFEI